VSEHEASLKRYAELVAERQLEHAKAALAETRAGTWQPDLAIAEAAVAVARAELEQAEVELDRLVVRAPVAARILRINVRPGELVQPETGAILLGDTERLHVRVSIDESDVPRFRPGARARASIKGLGDPTLELRFVRTEPYVVPKKSLTGQTNERVDTRVLEVIFAIEGKPPVPIFVGQQIDAFIEESRS
jgi:multidrug resistance efflux pump